MNKRESLSSIILRRYSIVNASGLSCKAEHYHRQDAREMERKKEVLVLRACAEESKDGWSCLLQDVRQRGVWWYRLSGQKEQQLVSC
jgi:hypothetical protein